MQKLHIYIYMGYILEQQKNKLGNHFRIIQNMLGIIIMFSVDDQLLSAKNNMTFGKNRTIKNSYYQNCTVQKAWKALHFVMRILKKGNMNTKSWAYTSLVRPILEYGAACWDPCREGQINALDRVQKKAVHFTNHTNDSDWETFAQRRTIARLCALLKAYSGEWAWKGICDRLRRPSYLSRADHIRKIRNRK